MSLNGNLEVFPLEEVLRLLARSRKSGCLRVESGGVQGRIFLTNGALALATTASDVDLRHRLLTSGLVSEQDLRKIELSGSSVTEALSPEVSSGSWADFVREESVEGLYRIRRSGRGTFDFSVELAPRYPTGQTFDSEVVLSESDRRTLEWEDIHSVLPELDKAVRMVAVLQDEEPVTLSTSTWQILAALGDGSSTSEVAQRIGWSEFRTAREMATLVRNGLVSVGDVSRPAGPVAAPAPDEAVVGAIADVEEPVEGEAPAAEGEEPEAAPEYGEPDHVPDEAVGAASWEEEPSAFETVESGTSEPETSGPEVDHLLGDAESEVVEEAAESSEIDSGVEVAETGEGDRSSDAWGAPEAPVASEPSEVAEPTPTSATSSWWSDEPLAEKVEEPDTPWGSSPWTADTPAEEPAVQVSPWGTPVDHTEPEVEPEPEPQPEPPVQSVAAESGEDRTRGWWAETMGAAEEGQGGTDTEADRFLESVFSSLSDDEDDTKTEKDEDETGFGMGLLRRRRMGAAARDISDNDR